MLVSPKVESSFRITPILAAGELSASIRRAMRGGLSVMGWVGSGSRGEAPVERLAGAQRLQLGVAEGKRLRQGPGDLSERHLRPVRRQAVERRPGQAGELLEAIERAGRLERLGIELERAQRGVAAGAAAGMLLQRRGM